MMRILERRREANAQGVPLVVAPVVAPSTTADLQSPQGPRAFRPVQRPVPQRQQEPVVNTAAIADGFRRAETLSGINVTFKTPPMQSTAEPGTPEAEEEESNFDIMKQFWDARMHFGLSRIKLGSYLHLIKTHRLWKGFAESWEGFLAKENVNPNAARQYMAVSKKFVFELDLPQQTLSKLSLAGITALEKAANTMSKENQEEVIAILDTLAERDAIQQLMEMAKEDDTVKDKPSLRVLSILKQISELPPDMQQQVKEKLAMGDKRRTAAREADDRAIYGRANH